MPPLAVLPLLQYSALCPATPAASDRHSVVVQVYLYARPGHIFTIRNYSILTHSLTDAERCIAEAQGWRNLAFYDGTTVQAEKDGRVLKAEW